MSKKEKPEGQQTHPKARKDDLSITSVGDETVVYDQLTHTASCLNEVTTAVWNTCDGQNDTDGLLDMVRLSGFQDATEEVVWLALEQLDQAGLLETLPATSGVHKKGINRREMLRSLGKRAAAIIPVVSTIKIQTAIAGLSCADVGESCITVPCCAGLVCNGVACASPS